MSSVNRDITAGCSKRSENRPGGACPDPCRTASASPGQNKRIFKGQAVHIPEGIRADPRAAEMASESQGSGTVSIDITALENYIAKGSVVGIG